MPPVNRKQPKRAKSSDSKYSLMEFMREFPDDDSCLNFLWRERYSDDGIHAHCPKCKTEREFKRYEHSQQRQAWTCQACGKHLARLREPSFTSLLRPCICGSMRCISWQALVAEFPRNSLSASLALPIRPAYRIAQKIRHNLMAEDIEAFEGPEPIEMDEAYIGGKRRGRKGSVTGRPGPDSHYVPVFGMVQRGGKVVAVTVENASRAKIMPHVIERVLPASTVYTDELAVYNVLGQAGYHHERVCHSEKVYVSGDCHTNTIEASGRSLSAVSVACIIPFPKSICRIT